MTCCGRAGRLHHSLSYPAKLNGLSLAVAMRIADQFHLHRTKRSRLSLDLEQVFHPDLQNLSHVQSKAGVRDVIACFDRVDRLTAYSHQLGELRRSHSTLLTNYVELSAGLHVLHSYMLLSYIQDVPLRQKISACLLIGCLFIHRLPPRNCLRRAKARK